MPSPIRIAVVVALASLCSPSAASAGTFHVYGLGVDGGGCSEGWEAHGWSPHKLTHANHCSSWQIRSNRDGAALRQGEFAAASMFTAPGARFTGFSIRSSGFARNGTSWAMAMCAEPYADCEVNWPRSGELTDFQMYMGNAYPGGKPLYATHLYAGVKCDETTCADSEAAGRAVDVSQSESHVIVEDVSPPGGPTLDGIGSGWNSGQKELVYSASDAGSGVESVSLAIGGSLQRTTAQPCRRLPTGGYSHPLPCATATGGSFTVNEPGQLADGKHTLSVTARDASSESGTTTRELWVDNNAPAAPAGLRVADGDGWRAGNSFHLSWENADQGPGSPVAGVYYRIGSAPAGPSDGKFVAGTDLSSLAAVEVPGDGEWPVFVWLGDEAGNARHSTAAVAHLRLDSAPPVLAFADARRADDPTEVRVVAHDRHSGLADGQIEIRRANAAEWQPLETRTGASGLTARIPDERLPHGSYELRAHARDAVGNRASTAVGADGRPMVLELPLRKGTHVSAVVVAGTVAARRVDYGNGVRLRGALRARGERLAHAPLSVHVRTGRAAGWQLLREIATDGDGQYAVNLGGGPSRDIRVEFAGTRLLRPATAVVRVSVRGRATLRLSPRRLRRGGTIAFLGRVGLLGAQVPERGKIVQIQYLDGRRWRPAVKLGRTDPRGRFAIRYRFRRISRPTRIHFRILVPAEGGWPYATGWSATRTAFVRP